MRADGATGRLDVGSALVGEVRVDLGDLDERAVLGEQPRDRAADAGTAAGDHRDLAVEELAPVVDRGDISGTLTVMDSSLLVRESLGTGFEPET